MSQEAIAHVPPSEVPLFLGMVMYETQPAVIDTIVAKMPAEVQGSIRDVAARAYAARARELYGTATPPRATG